MNIFYEKLNVKKKIYYRNNIKKNLRNVFQILAFIFILIEIMVIRIRAPGRITLFGEHQDYLGFSIIAMAISRYIYLEAERIQEIKFIIELPDINDNIIISL